MRLISTSRPVSLRAAVAAPSAPAPFARAARALAFTVLSFAVLSLTATASPASAQVSDDVVKIGVLTDMNGPASTPSGQGSVTAAQMAVEDFGGSVLGKPVTVIVGDHQLKPDVGAALARRWYDVDQVDIIVDVPVSAVGLVVQNVANDRKRMFITHSTGAADFHGKFCSATRCNGCSTPVRLPSAPRRRW